MKPHPLNLFVYCPHCGCRKFIISSDRSKRCSECEFEYFANVASCVAAIITDQGGRVLLIKRKMEPSKGLLDFPGGFAEINESLNEAATRELFEETGVYVAPKELSYLISLPDYYTFSLIDIPVMTTFFTAQVDSLDTLVASDDAEECIAIRLDDVDVHSLAFPSSILAFNNLIS